MRAARIVWHVVKRQPPVLLAPCAAAWLLLAAWDAVPSAPLCLSGPGGDLGALLATRTPVDLTLIWLAMLTAMMAPLLAAPLQHVWDRTLARRRFRALALFLLGYVLVWLAAGALILVGLPAIGAAAAWGGLPPLVLAAGIALFWQATPLKQIGLNGCHGRPPLAAFGWRAETDALRYGAAQGAWCVATCWALMLPPLSAGGVLHWILMVVVTAVAILERVGAPRAARWGVAWPGLPVSALFSRLPPRGTASPRSIASL